MRMWQVSMGLSQVIGEPYIQFYGGAKSIELLPLLKGIITLMYIGILIMIYGTFLNSGVLGSLELC